MSNSPALPGTCTECHATIPQGSPGGVCPRCLLAMASSSGSVEGAFVEAVPPRRFLGDYELRREIGRGGMGVVYEAWQISRSRTVALKMVLAGGAATRSSRLRFHVETEAVARLDHPNILPIYGTGEHDGQLYFTTRLVTGGHFGDYLRGSGFSLRSAVVLLEQICRAVAHAHAHGVLHRDLKPSNILLGANSEPFLSDFGLARLLDAETELTRSTDTIGSPNYMAPEQVLGSQATVAADVYSLGAILYQILTRVPPFHAPTVLATMRLVTDSDPKRPGELTTGVDRDLETVALRCLEKEPARRYVSAQSLAEDLHNWLDGRGITARPLSRPERIWSWAKRHPAPAGLAAALTLSLTGLALVLWRENQNNLRALERSRAAETASIHAEAEALAAEARAKRETGQWLIRDSALTAVRRSWQLHPSAAARDEFVNLHALPELKFEGSVRYPRGANDWRWAARPDRLFERHAVIGSDCVIVRDLRTNREICRVPDRNSTTFPPGPLAPDGRFLFVRSDTRTALWRLDPVELVAEFPRERNNPAFSPDSRWMALRGGSGAFLMCDLHAQPVSPRRAANAPPGWNPRAISPDGTRVLLAGPDKPALQLYDCRQERVVQDFPFNESTVPHHIIWDAEGTRFFCATFDGAIFQWTPPRAQPDWILPAHAAAIDHIALFDEGRALASQGRDGRTRLWSLATREQVAELPWLGRLLYPSLDGRRLLIDRAESSRGDFVAFVPSAISQVAAMPVSLVRNTYLAGTPRLRAGPGDERWIVTGGFDVHVYKGDAIENPDCTLTCDRCEDIFADPAGAQIIRRQLRMVTVLPLATAVPTAGSDATAAAGYDLGPFEGTVIAFHQPSRRLLIGHTLGFALYDFTTSPKAAVMESPAAFKAAKQVTACAWSSSGRLVAWCDIAPEGRRHIARLNVADMKSGQLLGTAILARTAAALAFSPDESSLYCGDHEAFTRRSADLKIEHWRVPLSRDPENPVCMAVAASGAFAASLERESVSLIDPATGAVQLTLTHPARRAVRAFDFSSDSRSLIVFAGHLLQHWRLDAIQALLKANGMERAP
jgi:WD40 repeat protein